MAMIAEAMKQPIAIRSENHASSPTREHEEAASMATALSSLMSVESVMDAQLAELESAEGDNRERRERIESRVQAIRRKIDIILGTNRS
jgi:ERCC4-type nuclease